MKAEDNVKNVHSIPMLPNDNIILDLVKCVANQKGYSKDIEVKFHCILSPSLIVGNSILAGVS